MNLSGQLSKHGGNRYNIFREHILRNEPLLLSRSGEDRLAELGVDTKGGNVLIDLNASTNIDMISPENGIHGVRLCTLSEDDKPVKVLLSDLEKTSEFGGIQASISDRELAVGVMYDLLRQSNVKSCYDLKLEDISSYTPESLKTPKNIDFNKIKQIALSEDWRDTTLGSADIIYNNLGSEGLIFFKNEIVKKFFNKFVELNKEQQVFGDFNKWNPADIWFGNGSRSESDIIVDLGKCKSFSELNKLMESFLESKELVGISLKHFAGEKGELTVAKPRVYGKEETDSQIVGSEVNLSLDSVNWTFKLREPDGGIHSGKLQFNLRVDKSHPMFEAMCQMQGMGARVGEATGKYALSILGVEEQDVLTLYSNNVEFIKELLRGNLLDTITENSRFSPDLLDFSKSKTISYLGIDKQQLEHIKNLPEDEAMFTVQNLARKCTLQQLFGELRSQEDSAEEKLGNLLNYVTSRYISDVDPTIRSCSYVIIH